MLFRSSGIWIKSNWNYNNFPRKSQTEELRQNLIKLSNAITIAPDLKIPSNLEKMTIAKANEIEKILKSMWTLLHNIQESYKYCGEYIAGEDVT